MSKINTKYGVFLPKNVGIEQVESVALDCFGWHEFDRSVVGLSSELSAGASGELFSFLVA
ncbi:MAG: hypothetical protein AB7J46_07125 [Candidatus Altimarinota bacterium]